ncbi:DUF222 domain-containing protein [Micromonospora sp. NPDC126480]|uniref:HNH endonuclease signature motif containing protein n=1 Tax=Micromonospora sp. NPDC126480 TaxID=3155312 RepID=UPI003323908F
MLEELARAEVDIRPCVDAAVWSMPDQQLVDALDAAHRLEQRLAAVKLALVRELDGRGTAVAQGASSTAVWLRERLRLTVRRARRLVELAVALDAGPGGPSGAGSLGAGLSMAGASRGGAAQDGPAGASAGSTGSGAGFAGVRAALADGWIDVEQARVIAETVAKVRAEAGAEAAERSADLLVDWSGQFDAGLLRRLSARILDHIAPEVAERAAEKALAAEAARADRDRYLTLSHHSDGRLRLTGNLDSETAALLHAALDPLTAPSGPDDTRTPGQRRHDALADLCRLTLRTGQLPEHGGEAAQIIVTTAYDALAAQLGTGALDTGLTLPADSVRRLACDAAILPIVLGGAGQVLDVGRRRRLIAGPLRRALVLRDRGCAFPSCDRPPRWCEGHHLRHWADGGETSLANAVLLCRHHHRQIHHHDWHVRLAADGLPEFLPPAWLDPDRRPRRNHHHRPHLRPTPRGAPGGDLRSPALQRRDGGRRSVHPGGRSPATADPPPRPPATRTPTRAPARPRPP